MEGDVSNVRIGYIPQPFRELRTMLQKNYVCEKAKVSLALLKENV